MKVKDIARQMDDGRKDNSKVGRGVGVVEKFQRRTKREQEQLEGAGKENMTREINKMTETEGRGESRKAKELEKAEKPKTEVKKRKKKRS